MQVSKMSGIILLVLLVVVALCAAAGDGTGVNNRVYTGKTLFEMGQKFNKPFWKLLGKTFMQSECRSSECSEWSKWSSCSPIVGSFGVRSRERQCGGSTSSCLSVKPSRNDTYTQVCDSSSSTSSSFSCLPPYVSTDGFCFKFHNDSKVNKDDAVSECKAENAFIVNINSQRKWDAIDAYLKKNKYSDTLWIDGQKKNKNLDWEYSYETDITGFTNWLPREPSKGSTELCKANYYRSQQFKLIDAVCGNKYFFICEKIK